MIRKSKLFRVKTYDLATKNELGGVGLYYAFGYESDLTGYRIFVFNDENSKYKILLKDTAAGVLEYYEEDPIDDKLEKMIIRKINKNTVHDIE
jgi:hypothetical protein